MPGRWKTSFVMASFFPPAVFPFSPMAAKVGACHTRARPSIAVRRRDHQSILGPVPDTGRAVTNRCHRRLVRVGQCTPVGRSAARLRSGSAGRPDFAICRTGLIEFDPHAKRIHQGTIPFGGSQGESLLYRGLCHGESADFSVGGRQGVQHQRVAQRERAARPVPPARPLRFHDGFVDWDVSPEYAPSS